MGVAIASDVNEDVKKMLQSFELRLRQILNSSRQVLILEEVPFAVMPGTRTSNEFRSHMRLIEVVNAELLSGLHGAKEVRIINVNSFLCPDGPPCALDEGGKLLYWHKTHLNRNGSLRLSRFWEDVIRDAVGTD